MKVYKVYYCNADQEKYREDNESGDIFISANSHREAKDKFIEQLPSDTCERIFVAELTEPFTHDIFLNPRNTKPLILSDQAAASTSPQAVGFATGSYFTSGFVVFLNVFGYIGITASVFSMIAALNVDGWRESAAQSRSALWTSCFIGFGSAMSLFISAHVIKTIEKCAFYLENLNKKNSGCQK